VLEIHTDKKNDKRAAVDAMTGADFTTASIAIRTGEPGVIDPRWHDFPVTLGVRVFPMKQIGRERRDRQKRGRRIPGDHTPLYADHHAIKEVRYFGPDVADPCPVRCAV
jgi:hypothetical protein